MIAPKTRTPAQKKQPLRAHIFAGLLNYMEKHPGSIPDCLLCRIQLQILAWATAKGFKTAAPMLLFSREPLLRYARWTANEPLTPSPMVHALGKTIRTITGITDEGTLTRLVFLLYRNIGIQMIGSIPGEIYVERCFFSRCYSPERCALMSNMDDGIVSGIMGGGKLVFTERITEGCGRCRACFVGNYGQE